MSMFDRLDHMVSRTVDAVNQIPFVFRPMTANPNGRPGPDENRQVIEGQGIFDYVDVDYGIELGVRNSYGQANDLRALQTGREPLLSLDRRWFPIGSQEPKQGDRIEFPTKSDLPPFEVVSVKRDGMARMILQLVHFGSQA